MIKLSTLPEQNSALFNENTFLTTLDGFVVSQSGTAQVLRKLKGLDLRTKCGCRTVGGGNKNNLPDEIQIKISLCSSWSHQIKEERYFCRHLMKIRTKTLNVRWLSLNICPSSTTAFVLSPPLSPAVCLDPVVVSQ